MMAELIARELGAIVLFYPNSHPQLNSIEQVWRALKQYYRKSVYPKNIGTLEKHFTNGMNGKVEGLLSKEQLDRQYERVKRIR